MNSQKSQSTRARVLIFGDSIAHGLLDTEGGWADRLKQHMHQRFLDTGGSFDVQVCNLGISGKTSQQILSVMPDILQVWASRRTRRNIMLIMLGTNEQQKKDGRMRISIDDFAANVEEMIKLAGEYSCHVVLVAAPPLPNPEAKYEGKKFSDQRIEQYNQRIREIAEKTGAGFIPLREVFEKPDSDNLYAPDQIHPNNAGHKLIFETIEPEVGRLLE